MDYDTALDLAREAALPYVKSQQGLLGTQSRRLALDAKEERGVWEFSFGIIELASMRVLTLDDRDPRIVTHPWLIVRVFGSGPIDVQIRNSLASLLRR